MDITQKDQALYRIFVLALDAAPGAVYWEAIRSVADSPAGLSPAQLAALITATPQFQTFYPPGMADASGGSAEADQAFVSALITRVLGAASLSAEAREAAFAAADAIMVEAQKAGQSEQARRATLINALADYLGAISTDPAQPGFDPAQPYLSVARQVANKVVVAAYYSAERKSEVTDVEVLREALSRVSDTSVVVGSGGEVNVGVVETLIRGFDQETQQQLYRVFVVAFDAAPGGYWGVLKDLVEKDGVGPATMTGLITASEQFQAAYPSSSPPGGSTGANPGGSPLGDASFSEALITRVLGSASVSTEAREAAFAAGEAIMAEAQRAGQGEAARRATLINALADYLAVVTSDPGQPDYDPAQPYLAVARQLANKVAVAQYYTAALKGSATEIATLQQVLARTDAQSDVSTPEKIAQLIEGAPANRAPSFGLLQQTLTVPENSSTVATITANDPDPGDRLSYVLDGKDKGAFKLDAATGALSFAVSPNYEADPQNYALDITAIDNAGARATLALTVLVRNIDEAPRITSASSSTMAENSALTAPVYLIQATDPDAGDVLTFGLEGADASQFTIDPATGVVTLKTPADHEAKPRYLFDAFATDRSGLKASKAVTLSITDVNEAPSITSGASASVKENAPLSTQVYTAAARDPDAGEVLGWSLTGTDANALQISAAGEVTLKAAADFETKSSYAFNVVATDKGGLSASLPVVLTVIDIEEVIALPVGAETSVAATAAGDTFALDVAGARTTQANTQLTLTGFDARVDSLRFTLPGSTSNATTLATLNGQQGVVVEANPFSNALLLTFGPDANGDVIALTLAGITDPSAVRVAVVAAANPGAATARSLPITAAGSTVETPATNTTFLLGSVNGTYLYEIAGFGSGDRIAGPAGVVPSLDNASFDDGRIGLWFASTGNIVTIVLTGLSATVDSALFGPDNLNTVFGAGTIG